MTLGASGGFVLGRMMLMRASTRGLARYSDDLLRVAEQYSSEITGVLHTMQSSELPFCSEGEIVKMQALSYRYPVIKDVGRLANGKLSCSAFLGRLKEPYNEGEPTIVLPDGVKVFTNLPLLLATTNHGTVIDSGSANVVLSPNSYDHLHRPNLHFMVTVTNPATGQVAPIAGDILDIEPVWVLAQGGHRTASELYNARCSPVYHTCIVTAESLGDVWSSSKGLIFGYAALGGVAGLGIGLAFAVAYVQTKSLASQLRRSLRRDCRSLSMAYQPIVDLPTRRITGVEALIRRKDEDGKQVNPGVFVQLAEERGFIGELTEFVIRRTASEMAETLRTYPELTLNLNIAASDLEGDTLIQLLEKYMMGSGIKPSQIVLELTERSTADLSVVGAAIQRLQGVGHKVHIDDFGIGYSNLSYLNHLSVDAIKIDASFTRTIGTEAATSVVLPHILNMVNSMDMNVIVEGVEELSQVDFLESSSKQLHVQGWLFGRPVPVSELKQIIVQEATTAPDAAVTADSNEDNDRETVDV